MSEARAGAHLLLFGAGRVCGRVVEAPNGDTLFRAAPPSSPSPLRSTAVVAVALATTGCAWQTTEPAPLAPVVPPRAPLAPDPEPLAFVAPTPPSPPVSDRDGDGVSDDQDMCPDQPGNLVDPTRLGCKTFVGILLTDDVRIVSQIHFRADQAVLLPEVKPVLDEVAQVLLQNPAIKKVRVIGHASKADKQPAIVSLARAKAVQTALVKRGVDAARLEAEGQGKSMPIVEDVGAEGQALNRRVQFEIVDDLKDTSRGP